MRRRQRFHIYSCEDPKDGSVPKGKPKGKAPPPRGKGGSFANAMVALVAAASLRQPAASSGPKVSVERAADSVMWSPERLSSVFLHLCLTSSLMYQSFRFLSGGVEMLKHYAVRVEEHVPTQVHFSRGLAAAVSGGLLPIGQGATCRWSCCWVLRGSGCTSAARRD